MTGAGVPVLDHESSAEPIGVADVDHRPSTVDWYSTATRADASSSALIVYHDDGSQSWLLHGPLLLRFREGNGNLPRGLYNIDGSAWRLDISADGHLTVSGAYRIVKDVCATLQDDA